MARIPNMVDGRKPSPAALRAPALPDGALWHEAMRGVVPLPGRAAPSPRPRPPAPPAVAARPASPSRPAPRPLAHGFADIDRATSERLKRGRHRIEAQLDLHGMTQAAAHRALFGFVVSAREAGRRCVLVITGRGLNGDVDTGEPGILRRAVPRWLDEPGLRPHVLAIAPAQPRHGGAGALYLLLRRRR
jgi:DNA-nicking Smr family endonuclease